MTTELTPGTYTVPAGDTITVSGGTITVTAPAPPPPPPPPPSGIQVNISAAGFTAAQYTQLHAWGFGGVMGGQWQLNGMNAHVPCAPTALTDAFGDVFADANCPLFAGAIGNPLDVTTSPFYAQQRAAKADSALAHGAGLKYYAGLPWYNIYWSGQDADPTFAAPMLGGWEGADWDGSSAYTGYQDRLGRTWQHWFRAIADYGDFLHWAEVDGLAYDNEDNRTQSNMVWWWQTAANNWGGTTPIVPTVTSGSYAGKNATWQHASTQAATQKLAYIAGQRMMYYLNNGRCDDFVGNLHAPNGHNYALYGYMTANGKHGNIPGGYIDTPAWSRTVAPPTAKVYWPKGPGAVGGYVSGPAAQIKATSTWMWWVAGMASKTAGQFVLGNSAYYFPGALTAAHWQVDLEALANINATMNASPGSPGGFALPPNVTVAPYIWLLVSTTVHTQFRGDDWGQATWNATKAALLAAAESGSYNIYLAQTPISQADFANDAWSSPPGANYTPVNK